jgi:hypothetical protein
MPAATMSSCDMVEESIMTPTPILEVFYVAINMNFNDAEQN